MGYSLYISKNTFVSVDKIPTMNFHPVTKTVVVKETILELEGWEIAEEFEKFREGDNLSGSLTNKEVIKLYKKISKIMVISTDDAKEMCRKLAKDMDSYFTYSESF